MRAKVLKLAKEYSAEIMDYVTIRTNDNRQKYDIFIKRGNGEVQNYVVSYAMGKAGTKNNLTSDFEKFLKGDNHKSTRLSYSSSDMSRRFKK